MICDNETADGSTIRMMPDIHPGRIAPTGLSRTVTDKVIPQLLGIDIGCGMTCVKLNKSKAELQKPDRSLGTLGGGNHFIEPDKVDDGSLYHVVYTGSRHLGEEVAEYCTKLAISEVMSKLKGKSALMIFDRHPEYRDKNGRYFWAGGYYAETIGPVNEETMKEYDM